MFKSSVTPILLLAQDCSVYRVYVWQNLAVVLVCLFPAMQSKAVWELISAALGMNIRAHLYTSKFRKMWWVDGLQISGATLSHPETVALLSSISAVWAGGNHCLIGRSLCHQPVLCHGKEAKTQPANEDEADWPILEGRKCWAKHLQFLKRQSIPLPSCSLGKVIHLVFVGKTAVVKAYFNSDNSSK